MLKMRVYGPRDLQMLKECRDFWVDPPPADVYFVGNIFGAWFLHPCEQIVGDPIDGLDSPICAGCGEDIKMDNVVEVPTEENTLLFDYRSPIILRAYGAFTDKKQKRLGYFGFEF